MNCIKKIISFPLYLLFSFTVYAQEADSVVIRDLVKKDWITLDKDYSNLKDSIKDKSLKLVTESILNIKFNKIDAALSSIDTLLYKYQEKIGVNNTLFFLHRKISLLEYKGKYKMILEEIDNFLNQTSSHLPKDELNEFLTKKKYFEQLKEVKPLTMEKPIKNIEIPFGEMKLIFEENNNDKISTAQNYLGVTKLVIHGKEYIYLFDTGAEKTIIFTKHAKNLDLKYLNDSIEISGVGLQKGETVILDSISLSEIIFRNIPVIVTDNIFENSQLFKDGSANRLGGVLGVDLIKRLGEIQIYPQSKKIIIPLEESELPNTGKNIFFAENSYLMTAVSGINTRPLTFLFDTGNTNSYMSMRYYQRYKSTIKHNLKKEVFYSFGAGNLTKTNLSYILPSFNIEIGHTSFQMNQTPILTTNYFIEDLPIDGSLGFDFIQGLNKLTLNLNKMFLTIEK